MKEILAWGIGGQILTGDIHVTKNPKNTFKLLF
jgi:hypothetical protein